MHFGLRAIDDWFLSQTTLAPEPLRTVLNMVWAAFSTRYDYGHHPVLILAAELDPRYAGMK